MKNKVIKIEIYVEGGMVQGVRTNTDQRIAVGIFDVDNKMAEGLTRDQIEKEWESIASDCSHAIY